MEPELKDGPEQAVSRRGFLRCTAGAVTAPFVITSSALGGQDVDAASERVTLALIGAGNRGGALMNSFLHRPDAEIVATCDPFKSRRRKRARQVDNHYAKHRDESTYTSCTPHRDYRRVMERDDIDAVIVATPDHWHVPIATAAARAQKHMYVEKPLGLSIEWNKACREECHRAGIVFQYGTQQRSMSHCRHGCELVRNGRIGEIKAIKVTAPNGATGGSTKPTEVPDNFDYDLWLGPAPVSPYTSDRCTNQGAWFVYDNSIGFLGGWGAHPLDIAVWGCGFEYPVPAEVKGTGRVPTEGLFDTVVDWQLQGRYPNGARFEFTTGGDSTTFVGTEGWVRITRGGNDAEPASLLNATIGPEELHLHRSGDHAGNFIEAIKTHSQPVSPVDQAVQSDFISHLSDIAVRTGRRIKWDPEAETIMDDVQGARLMDRSLRAPYHL